MSPKKTKTLLFSIKSSLWIFLWVFSVNPIASFAQTTHHFLVRGGVEHLANRDKGMSPLMYSGYGFAAGLAWHKTSPKRIMELAVNLSTGTQNNKYKNPIHYQRGNIQIAHFYKRNEGKAKAIHWGWFINNTFGHRLNEAYVNFNDHYEYFSNIGPAASYSFPLALNGREVMLTGSAYVQLLGLMIRPSYTSSFPDGFLKEQSTLAKGLVHSSQIIHPGNSRNFGFRPSLIYPLKSGNKLSLGYNYEFYRLNSTNTVTHSGGLWYFSLFARL